MVKRNLIFGVLILLVIGLYYIYTPSDKQQSPFMMDITTEPTFQSKTMITTVYDPAGNRLYKILANQVTHYTENGDTFFQAPDLTIFNPKGSVSWHISANEARLTKDRMLNLNGNVKLVNLTPKSQLQRITMSTAQINLTTQIVTSRDQVTLEGPGFYSTGSKLRGNLKEKTAHLLENVKTFYSNSLQ